jgi:ribosome-associated protein
MELNQLLTLVKKALEDKKAEDIKVLDVRKLCSFTDIMVVASGISSRQVSAMAHHLIEQVKAHGKRPLSETGRENGEWALVDLGDVVVHLMQPQIRNFYQLERLWSDLEGEDRLPQLRGNTA